MPRMNTLFSHIIRFYLVTAVQIETPPAATPFRR